VFGTNTHDYAGAKVTELYALRQVPQVAGVMTALASNSRSAFSNETVMTTAWQLFQRFEPFCNSYKVGEAAYPSRHVMCRFREACFGTKLRIP
jgi:hypothetical protein